MPRLNADAIHDPVHAVNLDAIIGRRGMKA